MPKGRGKKAAILDLDGGGEDSVNRASAMEGQKMNDEFVKLEWRLGFCNKCGPGKWCKINKLSTHIHLTVQQLGGWAHVLVHVFFFQSSHSHHLF